MEPFYNHINDQYQVWKPCQTTEVDWIDVSEIWLDQNANKVEQRKRIHHRDIPAWLNQTVEGHSRLLQLVWVNFRHMEKVYDISSPVLELLLENFHIEVAAQWNRTAFASLSSFPPVQYANDLVFSYSSSKYPKTAAAWSHIPSKNLTRGVFFATQDRIPRLQSLLGSMKAAAGHQMLVALVFGMSLSGIVENVHMEIKDKVHQVEVRTRFHPWTSLSEAPAQGSYPSLLQKMTGAKTRLASLCKKTEILQETCGFIRENLFCKHEGAVSLDISVSDLAKEAAEVIERYTRVLEKRTALQKADIRYFQERTEAQHVTLSNMILHRQATASMAIANANMQDSLSLKTLALVTMIFLPGTFLATVFSMPLLKWDGDGHEKVINNRFWVYWALAIPLTILTFATWGFWTFYLQSNDKRVKVKLEGIGDAET
ncbi:hypothetical protein BDV59DRAFT_211044 [Aspergillus ambiguus]|uniref:uncharacterized protein n=1 Tax=Aspergillus ambiguus TaxID=176160 RepID=UPI003CCE1366